jgi:hypothetical protein
MLNSNTNMSSYKAIGVNVDEVAEQSKILNHRNEVPRKQGRMFQLNLGQNVSLASFIVIFLGRSFQIEANQRLSINRQICNLQSEFDCKQQDESKNRHFRLEHLPLRPRLLHATESHWRKPRSNE